VEAFLKKCGKAIAKKQGFAETSHLPRPRAASACDSLCGKIVQNRKIKQRRKHLRKKLRLKRSKE